jgi:excisionase family DNA binding protein
MSTATLDYPRPLEPQLLSVVAAMTVLNLGRTRLYELINTGRLRSVQEGRRRLIPLTAIRDYIALLEQEAGSHQ